MEGLNRFFKRIYTNPGLMWKLGAGVLFTAFALVLYFAPGFANSIDPGTRTAFAALLFFYGLFRLGTFYAEYKRPADE